MGSATGFALLIGAVAMLGCAGATGRPPATPAGGGRGEVSVALPAPAPGDVLDLANWKLQLPTGEPGAVTEIRQPELRTFVIDPYFRAAPDGRGVIFRAPAGGVTTPHSQYPRSELREMTNAGTVNAAWSNTEGTHTMTITEAVTHVPVVKPQVVAGQIHDASAYVILIRLEGQHLFVQGDGHELGTLDPSYVLGRRFTVRIVAADGRIRVYHDDMSTPKVDVPRVASSCYFKAGVYTQSNPAHGELPDAYGEVAIYALSVDHR